MSETDNFSLAELSELLARQLKSPRAIDRLTSYIRQARPRSEEMLVDEALAMRILV